MRDMLTKLKYIFFGMAILILFYFYQVSLASPLG